MAKVVSKGTVLKQDISSTLTAVAQVITINESGAQSETVESRTLDGGAWLTHTPTGYAEPGEVSGDMYYDPALAGHQAFTDLIGAPAATAFQVTFADTGATTKDFSATGFGFGYSVDGTDLLKGQYSLKISGDPGFPT